jgi:glycosyltransferase involved in cell wall biosynthesis
MNQTLLGKIRKIQSTYPGSCCGIDISRIISEDLLNKKIKSLYKNDLIYLSYIGRPYSRKGFPYILNLFEKILEINPERKIILQIIGIKKKLILEKIKNEATLSSIYIIEYTNQVDYYLRKSCFLILPSLREGFGYAFLEGASAGNALASFDITGPDSLLKSNFNALIVKKESSIDFFANYISNTLNNPRKLSALMKNARKSSFSFDKRTVLNSLRKIL